MLTFTSEEKQTNGDVVVAGYYQCLFKIRAILQRNTAGRVLVLQLSGSLCPKRVGKSRRKVRKSIL